MCRSPCASVARQHPLIGITRQGWAPAASAMPASPTQRHHFQQLAATRAAPLGPSTARARAGKSPALPSGRGRVCPSTSVSVHPLPSAARWRAARCRGHSRAHAVPPVLWKLDAATPAAAARLRPPTCHTGPTPAPPRCPRPATTRCTPSVPQTPRCRPPSRRAAVAPPGAEC